jgi:putative ABC transport system permease protein
MIRRLAFLFQNLFRRRRVEDDLDEELRSSLDMIVDQYIARGLSESEARRAAHLEFEGVEQVKEQVRDGFAGSGLHAVFQDLRHAWRALRRRLSFAIIAMVTLALGIGVNTAVFSVFYAVLLHPLPYDQPDRLVLVWAGIRTAGTTRSPASGLMFRELERRQQSLSGLAGIWVGTGTFTGDEPEQVKVAQVTPNFFDVLGVRAAHGRSFVKEEEAGGRPAIMLTDGFFRRRFASDTARIGQLVQTQETSATLVGVLPADFQLQFTPGAGVPPDIHAFIPFPYNIYQGNVYYLRMIARLKPGVTIAQAQSDLDRVAAEIRGAYSNFAPDNLHFTLTGMQADAARDIQPALAALFAGAGFVLLICCVNVTSLLLARASDRRKEIALRVALGASRGRILRQLLVESALLCLLAGTAGIVVGWVAFRGLLAIRPDRLASIGDAQLSWPILAFAAGASVLVAVLLGLVPAFESFRLNHMDVLRTGGRGWLGRLHRRAGGALVISEVTLGFVLVTGAALTARTLANIEHVHPGFDARNLLTFQISFGQTLNPDLPLSTISDWERHLAALPGVERVGATSHLPLDDFPNWFMPYRPRDVAADRASGLIADHRCVTPGYLAAMGVRLVEGRHFDHQDRAGGRPVIIVDELLARSHWPGQSAVGKVIDARHVINGQFIPVPSVVVGVVEHVRNHSLTRQVRGEIYIPFEQSSRSPLTFVLRTNVEPLSLVPTIRAMLRQQAPQVAMAKVRLMTDYVARDVAPAGFTAVLAAIFGGLALLLAATGIYGVLNYQVSRRLPEMGIRMAVGAAAHDVLRLVLKEGLLLAAAGVLLGAAAATVVARWLSTLLFGVSAHDPLSYALALLLLPAAAILGCWRPAWRAASANPSEIIREE